MSGGMFDDKIQELMKLIDEKGIVEVPPEEGGLTKEELMQELRGGTNDEVLVGNQASMAEFSIMMSQWDALVADYERRDAEEAAEEAAKEKSES